MQGVHRVGLLKKYLHFSSALLSMKLTEQAHQLTENKHLTQVASGPAVPGLKLLVYR
jgi:hypothetical protein